MTHTPGKWEILGPHPSVTVGVEFESDMFDIVATLWEWRDGEAPEVVKSNARLIAAAPLLLEACKELLKYVNKEDCLPIWSYLYLKAQAAIATAEGEEEG